MYSTQSQTINASEATGKNEIELSRVNMQAKQAGKFLKILEKFALFPQILAS